MDVTRRAWTGLQTRHTRPPLDAAPLIDAGFDARVEADRQGCLRERHAGMFHAGTVGLLGALSVAHALRMLGHGG